MPQSLPDWLADALAAHGGMLPLGTYMALSNQHYYARSTVIGRQGDFITAPEISQLFGEMLGIWVVQQWQALGSPMQWQLIELGPGRGTLMNDALRVILKFIPGDSFCLYAVETSPTLIAQQKSAWRHYPVNIEWISDIYNIPDGISVTLANEFLDALPIEQYRYDGKRWLQNFITYESGRLQWLPNPPLKEINSLTLPESRVAPFDPPARGGLEVVYECPDHRHTAIEPLTQKIRQHGGAALFIDYGFAKYACGDTLQAVKDHKAVGVLEYPGEADLTSHVNFAALQGWATAQGLQTSEIITQADLLHGLGIAERLKTLQTKADTATNLELLSAYQRLTAPSQMGTLFKALAIYHHFSK